MINSVGTLSQSNLNGDLFHPTVFSIALSVLLELILLSAFMVHQIQSSVRLMNWENLLTSVFSDHFVVQLSMYFISLRHAHAAHAD